jgi:hypothetical protein
MPLRRPTATRIVLQLSAARGRGCEGAGRSLDFMRRYPLGMFFHSRPVGFGFSACGFLGNNAAGRGSKFSRRQDLSNAVLARCSRTQRHLLCRICAQRLCKANHSGTRNDPTRELVLERDHHGRAEPARGTARPGRASAKANGKEKATGTQGRGRAVRCYLTAFCDAAGRRNLGSAAAGTTLISGPSRPDRHNAQFWMWTRKN